jgi:hypothetical protein
LFREPFRGKIRGEAPENKVEEKCSRRRACTSETLGRQQEGHMAENEHPRGALLFILIFLVIVVVFWINTYMRLWLRY